jgi:lipopolysaccharide transport system permease protein
MFHYDHEDSSYKTTIYDGMSARVSQELPIFEIRPSSGWRMLDLRELWNHRELICFLTMRDVKVRYKQTAIGIVWALLQPIAMTLVFTLFFGRLAGVDSGNVPYPLFALAALLPWQLFSRTITESTNSLVTDQRLITRVYFPRIIVPIASTLAALADFLIAFGLLIIAMVAWSAPLRVEIVWLPAFLLLMLATSLGVGFWLSALNVEYRDVMYTVPFLNQFWFFITPVVYSSSVVPQGLRFLYGLNPMVGVVEGFRWALFGIAPNSAGMLLASTAVASALIVSGTIWFRRRERTFVDAIGSGGR